MCKTPRNGFLTDIANDGWQWTWLELVLINGFLTCCTGMLLTWVRHQYHPQLPTSKGNGTQYMFHRVLQTWQLPFITQWPYTPSLWYVSGPPSPQGPNGIEFSSPPHAPPGSEVRRGNWPNDTPPDLWSFCTFDPNIYCPHSEALAYRNRPVPELYQNYRFQLVLVFHCRRESWVKALGGWVSDSDTKPKRRLFTVHMCTSRFTVTSFPNFVGQHRFFESPCYGSIKH